MCIYLTKRHPPQVLRRLEALTQGSAVMSVVTYAELCAGLALQNANRAQDAFAGMTVFRTEQLLFKCKKSLYGTYYVPKQLSK